MGGNDTIKLDVRIITATHKNIAEEVRAGRFREDLYYRLMGLPIELPTLKQRGNDILILAKYFADMYALENKCPIFTFSQEAKDKLMKHHYPGNVRELKAIVDLACVMSDSNVISEPDITLPTNPIPVEQLFSAQEKSLKDYNTDIITFYLNKYNQNVLEVAKKLNIGKSTIYNLINTGDIKK